ncbi:MAG: polyisoprenoid-binding protein [Candidatus Wallbacteria bacterium]|nr:polyisoprenoid-binding protein [Candidatus Wallbacteria bacterium]MBI4868338.1 polyisoprenoid-binding protein [Candidatus Wallbacteria bacterium]
MISVTRVCRAAVALAVLFALPFAAQAATWEIDASHSSIEFSVRHLMISNVTGKFKDFAGTIDFDGKDASKATVEVTIQSASIDTGIEKRDEHLKNADFFDVAKHPTLTFKSTKVEPTGEKTAKITGDLTMHGVTKSVTLEAELLGTLNDPKLGSRAGFTGSTTVNRKDFGLTYNKVLEAGGVAVGEEVKVTLQIEATEKAAEPAKDAKGK